MHVSNITYRIRGAIRNGKSWDFVPPGLPHQSWKAKKRKWIFQCLFCVEGYSKYNSFFMIFGMFGVSRVGNGENILWGN